MNSPTRALAEFASELTYQSVPHQVLEHAKDCVADTVACGLFGIQMPWAKIVADFATDISDHREAALWGRGIRAQSMYAALANGTAINAYELDDTHADSIQHLGSEVLPAIVAAADKRGSVTGKEFLTAVVAGYEVTIRAGLAVALSSALRGFHTPAICGAFGAAAGSAKILGLPTEGVLNAIGIAGSLASGLQGAQFASMAKRMQPANAAKNGLFAALLAQRGFTGMADVLDDIPYGGFCKTVADQCHFEKITADLGRTFEVANIGFKAYSCSRSNHSTIDAVKDIMRRHPNLDVAKIQKITVWCSSITRKYGWINKIETTTSAQLSIPYCIAACLHDGEVFVDQFTDQKIRNPRILDLVSKVDMIVDSEIDKLGVSFRWNVRVRIDTDDGKQYEAFRDQPTGSTKYPLGRSGVQEKFMKLTTRVFPKESMVTLFGKIEKLDTLGDIADLHLESPK